MAIPTLSGSYIDQTYIRLVQTNDARTEFADGLGNPISFGGATVPGGPINSLQYNKDGTNFTGSSTLTFDGNNLQLTGSLNVTQGITGSLQGTASYATTASYAMNGGGGSSIDTGSFVTTSSFNAFTSSYNTGSFSGSFIGSLQGTASWAYSSSVAISSSFATTASYVMNAGTIVDTGSFVTTSSFNAFTQSINTATSSFVLNSQTSSMLVPYVLTSVTSSMLAPYVQNNQTSSFVQNSQTSSFVTTSSFNSFTSSYNTGSFSGSFTGNLIGTASFATSASQAVSASYASNGGVTQLLAGPNITLSPTNGLGQVTINSTGGGGGNFNTATGSYGSFYSTQTQTNVAGTARSMSLNVTDITNGVSISGSTNPFNTYIKTANAGVYNIQFSAQIDKTDSGTDNVYVWVRKNESDLSDTATSVTLVGNSAQYVAAWNFFVNAAANDYFQLMWYSTDANIRLHAEPAFGVVPGIPSLIVTANRVDQFLSNTGSFSGSFTGNLIGTATTASYISGSVFTSTNPALSASFALTASFALNAGSGGGGGISQGKVVAIATGYSNLF